MLIIILAGLIPIAASLVRSAQLTRSYRDQAGWFERDTSWYVSKIIPKADSLQPFHLPCDRVGASRADW